MRPSPRLHARLVDELIGQIVSGGRAPGAALPSEPEMSAAYGVSRAVVREALRILGAKGLVEVRQGSGTFVTAPERWDALDADLLAARRERGLTVEVLRDLVDARRIVEPEVAALAALRHDPSDAALLAASIATMRRSLDDPPRFVAADFAFHRALLAAGRNRVLERMMAPLQEMIRFGQEVTDAIPGVLARALSDHETIAAAVARHDAEAARAAMRAHLDATERDITSLGRL